MRRMVADHIAAAASAAAAAARDKSLTSFRFSDPARSL